MNTVFFCEPSESLRQNIAAYYKDSEEFSIRLFADKESLKKALPERPDAVVIDMDAGSMRDLTTSLPSPRPKTILTSRRMGDEIEEVLSTLTFDKVVYKPYSLHDLTAELRALLLVPERIKVMGNKSVDERLSNIFIRAGIPPQIKGYQYLRHAVKLAINEPDLVNNITKRLYPSVAEHFETTPSKVERAIRHAIEVAWSRGKIENINAIFGTKIYGKGDKPTNGELIALVADKMVIEMM
ncbi:MAG: hypothetical protein IJ735_03660 [Clostridia bacterium]|nr:hypothetical protein [Clostridia bacterium]